MVTETAEKKTGTFPAVPESEAVQESRIDLELAKRAAAGSRTAFEKIVERHQDMIYRLAYRFFSNEEDRLDAVQEVFVKAYRAIGRFEGRSSLKTWLYRVASNTFLTLAKEKTRRKKSLLESILDWFSQPSPPDPAQEVVEREYQVELQKAIADKLQRVPEVYRLPVILKDFEGRSLEEIGTILEIPEGTVKSRINRGRRILQEALEPLVKERLDV
jgi:RNA polymerase sigma-70 factor (ECF subfamily)